MVAAVSGIADREQRLRQLADANVAVGSEISLENVLQKTVETAAGLVAARYAALGVLDRTGSHLERLITTGIDEETRAEIGDLPGDHGVLRVLLREGRPVRVADVTEHPHFMGFPRGHPPMRSFLGVPILVRDVVYEDLYLAEKEGGEFTEDDAEIVTLLAAQTAITIEKVQIHEGLVRWLHQLEALNELTVGVLEERDLARLLQLVARRLRELIRARRVLISLPLASGAFASLPQTATVSRTLSATSFPPIRRALGSSRAARASASIHFWKIRRSTRSVRGGLVA